MTAGTCRRMAPIFALALIFCPALTGCALFSRHKSDGSEKEVSAFEQQRSDVDKMSEFAASAGRSNPREKKEADPGQTFLLSSKAKEIYNNTER